MLLVLPSDKEAIRYLADFGKELDLISGENCLVIVLGHAQFRLSGFEENTWKDLVEEHSSEGFSVKVAKIFGVQFTDFPCLIVFRDIRLPQHVLVTFAEKSTEQIRDQMRSVFSVIQEAASNRSDPLQALERSRNIAEAKKTGGVIISAIRTIYGKTFETAIQAFIKTLIAG